MSPHSDRPVPTTQAPPVMGYRLRCYGGGDHLGAPERVEFSIDRETARFILRMSTLVHEHDLHTIERLGGDAVWIDRQDDEVLEVMRSEGDCLSIDHDSFWLSCYRWHGSAKIESERCAIVDLATFYRLS